MLGLAKMHSGLCMLCDAYKAEGSDGHLKSAGISSCLDLLPSISSTFMQAVQVTCEASLCDQLGRCWGTGAAAELWCGKVYSRQADAEEGGVDHALVQTCPAQDLCLHMCKSRECRKGPEYILQCLTLRINDLREGCLWCKFTKRLDRELSRTWCAVPGARISQPKHC